MAEGEFEKIFRVMPGPERRPLGTFRVGDTVRVRSGPFALFPARVEGINQSRSLVKVSVRIFGRATPVKLSFTDIEKA
jgi:transcription termination/antitermination protein NusG